MNRLFAAALAVFLLVAAAFQRPVPASADLVWCFTDPVLIIDGKAVHIELGVPLQDRRSVTSSLLIVTVPANVSAMLAGESITNFPVQVSLLRGVPYSGSGPVPVMAVGTVNGRLGMPTSMQVWQASVGPLDQTTAVAGVPMSVSFDVR